MGHLVEHVVVLQGFVVLLRAAHARRGPVVHEDERVRPQVREQLQRAVTASAPVDKHDVDAVGAAARHARHRCHIRVEFAPRAVPRPGVAEALFELWLDRDACDLPAAATTAPLADLGAGRPSVREDRTRCCMERARGVARTAIGITAGAQPCPEEGPACAPPRWAARAPASCHTNPS